MTDYALKLSDTELTRYRMMAERAYETERDLWATAGIVAGASVADVGCGPGAMVLVLAEVVGGTGSVWAVDRDTSALTAARGAVEASGLPNVRFREGDAIATGLEPTSVDAVMMRHVLAHNGGREQAIVDHLATLVRPGGCVYLVDVEASAIRVRPEDPDLADLTDRYHEFQTRRGNDMAVGLRLGELLEAAGLEVVAYRGHYDVLSSRPGLRPPSWAAREAMVEAGIADAADVERWEAALARADQRRFTMFLPFFAAVGRRPA